MRFSRTILPENQSVIACDDAQAWSFLIDNRTADEIYYDPNFQFLIESSGYVMNKALGGFLNVIPQQDYVVRGYSSRSYLGRSGLCSRAGREYNAAVAAILVSESEIAASIAHLEKDLRDSAEMEEQMLKQISKLPPVAGNNVISFGLYGSNKKYLTGSIRNAELALVYYPGWKCRFYVTSDVPNSTLDDLRAFSHVEIVPIADGEGYVAGMFHRFLVASDAAVDRYIIRDVDSRLNARERFAVEEWIQSRKLVHIMRDHVNHCIPMNGGMWGGTKSAIPNMLDLVKEWDHKDNYMADLHFLEEVVWPLVYDSQMSHDSYCCDRFPSTTPFPTRRRPDYQHVGQVFNEANQPRWSDIDGFMLGIPVPATCRKSPDWLYG